MNRVSIEWAHKMRISTALESLSLAEKQLLLLGLWVIGEENRVDPRLVVEYGWLLNGLVAATSGTAAHVLSNTPAIAGVETKKVTDAE